MSSSQVDWENIIPSIDRILLITWLLKDFGWMSTNIYLGWPFGVTAIIYHALALKFDPRTSFRYYNASFLLWVTGNFIWLTLEFVNEPLSSDIHWGPDVPISPLSDQTTFYLSMLKLILFISSLSIQCIMYIGIYFKKIPMPRHFDEEIVCVNELALLLGKSDVSVNMNISKNRLRINDNGNFFSSPRQQNNPSHQQFNSIFYINEEQASLPISTAFVEYTYIIFWIMKDLFWSISTGDLGLKTIEFAIFSETIALFFGTIAFSVYCISAYVYRRHLLSFLDSVTTLLWISANYVWMSGEFFLRYQNMQLDDTTQGSDRGTRIISTILFTTGICLQITIVLYLSIFKYCYKRKIKINMMPSSMDSVSFNVKKRFSKPFTSSSSSSSSSAAANQKFQPLASLDSMSMQNHSNHNNHNQQPNPSHRHPSQIGHDADELYDDEYDEEEEERLRHSSNNLIDTNSNKSDMVIHEGYTVTVNSHHKPNRRSYTDLSHISHINNIDASSGSSSSSSANISSESSQPAAVAAAGTDNSGSGRNHHHQPQQQQQQQYDTDEDGDEEVIVLL